jgi:uncharacterized protein (TIRG00374 family)
MVIFLKNVVIWRLNKITIAGGGFMKKLPPQFLKWFRNGFSMVLIMTLCSSALLLFNSFPRNAPSFWHCLNYPVLALACLALFLSWLIEACRIWLIAAGLGDNIALAKVFKINLATSFIGNITPFYSGGVPTQIFLLTQNGIKPGRASAIVTIRLIVSTLFFTIFAPFLLYSFHRNFSFGLTRQVTLAAIPVSILISVLLIAFIVKPRLAKLLTGFILKIIRRTRFSRKVQPFIAKFLAELEVFHQSIREFRKAFHFYLVILTTIGYWFCFFAVAPLLMGAFGLNIHGMFFKSILLQFILFFVIAYLPIPGGSGVMELGLFSVLSFVPIQLRAVLIIVWRCLSYHLSTFVGGIILLRFINQRPSLEFPN